MKKVHYSGERCFSWLLDRFRPEHLLISALSRAIFQTFATAAASSLPLETSVGLNWSDAYIGQFPHFGIGLTVGAATIPFSAV